MQPSPMPSLPPIRRRWWLLLGGLLGSLAAVGETTISDLDSALAAYARLADADTVRVLVKRGSQWLDFTYTFVR